MKQEKKTLRLGLIGKDVSKSNSERIHKFILREMGVDCAYRCVSTDADGFDSEVKRLLAETDGFNVTIPYKLSVMSYLNETVGQANDFGAVNTVLTATKKGYNTDGLGFMQMLAAAGIAVNGKRVLVLGMGGSGRSTAVALKNAGANVYAYQRNAEKLASVCKELGVQAVENPETFQGEIVVNCTGVGMHQTEGVSPVSKQAFLGKETAVDLIYTPAESEFLRLAKSCGLNTINGASMLFYQAYFADCLYLGIEPSGEYAQRLYEKYLKE